MSSHVKVRFALERDADGWPPAESEGLWAEPIRDDLFRLDNTPWFARGVAPDDVIEARPDQQGVLWFTRVRERGERIVVRVIPRQDGPLEGNRQAVLDAFVRLRVAGREHFESHQHGRPRHRTRRTPWLGEVDAARRRVVGSVA